MQQTGSKLKNVPRPRVTLVDPGQWSGCGNGLVSVWLQWAGWAGTLFESRLPIHARITPSWLLHMKPIQRNNWLVRTNSYYPQIKLTIQSVLRASLFEHTGRSPLLIINQSPVGVASEAMVTTDIVNSYRRDYLLLSNGARDYLAARAEDDSSSPERRASAEPDDVSRWSRRESPASPLDIVFRRAAGNDEVASTGHRRISELPSGEVVERIARATRRVDSTNRTTTPLATVYRAHQKSGPISPTEIAGRSQQLERLFGTTAPLGAREAERPASVEQLADQVLRQLDRRIVAARERMGKSF